MNDSATTTETTETPATLQLFSREVQGPFRLIGLETKETRAGVQSYLQANGLAYTTNLCGGSCDHCGTAIFNVYRFRSACGVTFKVGSTCAEKCFGANTREAKTVKSLAKAITSEQNRARAKARKAKALEAARSARDYLTSTEVVEAAKALPHPHAGLAEQGKTYADYLEFMTRNAGNARVIKLAKEAAEKLGR